MLPHAFQGSVVTRASGASGTAQRNMAIRITVGARGAMLTEVTRQASDRSGLDPILSLVQSCRCMGVPTARLTVWLLRLTIRMSAQVCLVCTTRRWSQHCTFRHRLHWNLTAAAPAAAACLHSFGVL